MKFTPNGNRFLLNFLSFLFPAKKAVTLQLLPLPEQTTSRQPTPVPVRTGILR
jgi:hypothetical protein